MAEVSLPSLEWLRKQLQEADPDLLRAMVEGRERGGDADGRRCRCLMRGGLWRAPSGADQPSQIP